MHLQWIQTSTKALVPQSTRKVLISQATPQLEEARAVLDVDHLGPASLRKMRTLLAIAER